MTDDDTTPTAAQLTRRDTLRSGGALASLLGGGVTHDLAGGPAADAMSEFRVPYYRVPERDLDSPGVVGRRVEITSGGATYSAGDQLVDTGSSWERISAGVESLNTDEQQLTGPDGSEHALNSKIVVSDRGTAESRYYPLEGETAAEMGSTLETAISEASVGAEVRLPPQIYEVSLTIDDTIYMRSAGTQAARIRGDGSGPAVTVDLSTGGAYRSTLTNIEAETNDGNGYDAFRVTGGGSNVKFHNCGVINSDADAFHVESGNNDVRIMNARLSTADGDISGNAAFLDGDDCHYRGTGQRQDFTMGADAGGGLLESCSIIWTGSENSITDNSPQSRNNVMRPAYAFGYDGAYWHHRLPGNWNLTVDGEDVIKAFSSSSANKVNVSKNVRVTSAGDGIGVEVAENLSGKTGNFDGEFRRDDGTNTADGNPATCEWRATPGEWRELGVGTENTFT